MTSGRPIYSIWLVGFFALAFAPLASAQYRFNSWTTDEGLPQNTVYDIRQTRDGYLWLTTFDGLVRFDGVRFTVFNKGNTPGISSNRFLRMYEDVKGDLWAGTEDGGIVRYHDGHFTSYGKDQGLPGLFVVFESEDEQGRLLAFVAGGVMRFDDGKFQRVTSTSETSLSWGTRRESQYIPCLPSEGRIICFGFGAGWGIADGMPGTARVSRDAIQDVNGAAWFVMTEGLVKIENGRVAKVFTERDGIPGTPKLLVRGAHTSIASVDNQGRLWITDLENMQVRFMTSEFPPLFESPTVAYEDREGNIWFGSNRLGLFRARKQYIEGRSTAAGLTQKVIYPIFQDSQGKIWVGTDGLLSYNDGAFEPASLSRSNVTALAEDQTQRLLVAQSPRLWIRDGNSFRLLTEMPSGSIWCIYAGDEGTLWLGWEHGLVRLKDGAQTIYTTADGLAGNDVKVVIGDGAGGLWIGTYGGLSHYADGRFTTWTDHDGLPSNTLRALYRDEAGVLWIGTYDGGMARFKDGKFTRYTTKEGLFDSGAFQMLEDGRGNFWISSNRGIYRVRRHDLEEVASGRLTSITSVAYGKSDGMLTIECNGGRWPAGIKARDGKLWFPTEDGVAVIDPDAIPTNPQPPPVRVEAILLDNHAVDFGNGVSVQPDQENFEIQYTALSFINSENLRFKYKLEGLDHDWVDAGTRRTAYYSHVPPGPYTFKVIAANSDGVWNTVGASVQLYMRPHFYQTWWFRAFAALVVFGLAFAAYRVRVNRLELARRSHEEFSRKLLVSQEQERQRIAAELHDTLGQSLLIIKNRVAMAQADQDDSDTVTEQLEELSHSTAAAIEECREIAYNLRPYQISRFGLSKTLNAIFMRIKEVTEIEAHAEVDQIDDLLTDETQINLYRVVQESVNNIIKHSQASRARLKVEREEGTIAVLIEDNGRGFRPAEPLAGGDNHRQGFGLVGIAERIRIMRGSCEIDSQPGQGTRIRIRIPTR